MTVVNVDTGVSKDFFTNPDGICKDDVASPLSVLRSRRPQTHLEASCGRSGRPRKLLLDTSAGRRINAQAVRMFVSDESDSGIVPMNRSNKVAVDGAPPGYCTTIERIR